MSITLSLHALLGLTTHTYAHTYTHTHTHIITHTHTHTHIHTHRHTGEASDIAKAKSSGEDPKATGGLVSNLPHPLVNKTK